MATPTSAQRLSVAAFLILAAFAGDQLSKAWAYAELPGRPPRVVFEGLLELHFAFNPGSAFGLFATTPGARMAFIATTVLALLYIGASLWRLPGEPRSARAAWAGTVGLALMAGGALGNLADRLSRVHDLRVRFAEHTPFWLLIEHPREYAEAVLGGRSFADVPRHGVVDFIVVYYWPGRRWPSFNLADACLVVGVALLMLYLARSGEKAASLRPR